MKKILLTTLFLLSLAFLPSKVDAAVFYIDFNCTLNTDTACGNGTATTTPYSSLDQFTEVARNAGDIAFVRRGQASTTNVTDLTFTSNGTIADPIIISADYDNLWNDFASSTQTYTIAAATSTFTASANQSEIIVGEWVYVDGDCFETYNSKFLNQCEFAYEVSAVASTSISFHLPYKGNQTGSGHTLRILSSTALGSNPQWNVASGAFEWNFSNDNFWVIKGMDIRGTSANGQVNIQFAGPLLFFDTLISGNGAGDSGIVCDNGVIASQYSILKTRIFNNSSFGLSFTSGCFISRMLIKDSLLLTAGANSIGSTGSPKSITIIDSSISGFTLISAPTSDDIYLRNVKWSSIASLNTSTSFSVIYSEDDKGNIGLNKNYNYLANSNTIPITQSTTTVLGTPRSGGGPNYIEVSPSINVAESWIGSNVQLFEYPIYTNTTSKQYDVYFMSTSTTNWTTDPIVSATTTELWIECEYWAHDTNATSTRKIKKSTGVLDFNGSTAWQNLTVTCQPTQTGILYLRGWYAKTKESKSNYFFVDGTPVIQ